MIRRIDKYARENELVLIDSAKPLAVEIEECDIKGSRKLSPSDCAIARALKRKGYEAAFVFRAVAWVNDGRGHLVRYRLPPTLQKEVHAYDRSKMFEPGDYRLSPAQNRKLHKETKAGKRPQRKYFLENKDRINKNRRRLRAHGRLDADKTYKLRQTEFD